MSVLTPILKKFGATTPGKTPQNVHFDSSIGDVSGIISSLADENDEKPSKELFEVLLSPLTKDFDLESILIQLRDHVIYFEKEKEIIVPFLLKVSWSGRTQGVVNAYQNLMLNLISAHPGYLFSVMNMLVSHFLPKRDNKSLNENPTEEEKNSYENVHHILNGLLQLVPSSPSILLNILQTRFPYITKESYLHISYIYNLLAVCRYAPKLRQQVLELIINKLLQLDVNCSPKDIMDAEEEKPDEEIFNMECEDSGKKAEEGQVDGSESMKHPMANTLDCIMNLLFDFINKTCHPQDLLDWEITKKLYKELLAIFDKLILPTFGCAHVQYVMFYIVSFKPPLFEGFLDYLWNKVQDPNSASVMRQAAVAYISSLLARAKYISIRTVIACFDIICPWIHYYIDNQEGSSKVFVDSNIHGSFYAVCQAIFYVFAFRQSELTESHKSLEYLRTLNFERMVTSRLNPLKVCHSVVVKNFANIARNFQLAYCHTIIERNNRHCIPVVCDSTNGESYLASTQLSAFFPFDPYLLSRSGKSIASLYREYQGHVELDEAKGSEDEDDFLDGHEQTMSPQTPKVMNGMDDFFSYKLSPGFRHIISPKN